MFADDRFSVAVLAWLTFGASVPAMAAEAEGSAPPDPELLSNIAQRQTELAILEMDIKKAELQKKLRELQLPGQIPVLPPGQAPVLPPPPALAGDFPPGAAKNPDLRSGSFSVQRIHRVGDRLAAVVRFPSGETRSVFSGETLEKSLKVVAVSAVEVTVRLAGAEPYALPVVPAAADRR